MDNQNQVQGNNNNNARRFNNPFNLDPNQEDISIERKLDRDIFCPFLSLSSTFAEENEYYSMRTVDSLKESFFHAMEACIFPNATIFQLSLILCYIIVFVFIILLCFGLDETNSKIFLEVKLSTVDKIGSFYPLKMKKNFLEYYRLLTFHFLHFNLTHICMNLLSLVSFCSFFELLVKKYLFLLILFLSGIFGALSSISFFNENERFCGINAGISGILGAFIMLYIMNWEECLHIFGPVGRFLTLYIICVYIFLYFLYFQISEVGNISVQFIGFIFGALIFAIIVKPIRIVKWKLIVRICSGLVILMMTLISLISFYLK
jgi:membrane associated rhomboid family serine protease